MLYTFNNVNWYVVNKSLTRDETLKVFNFAVTGKQCSDFSRQVVVIVSNAVSISESESVSAEQ